MQCVWQHHSHLVSVYEWKLFHCSSLPKFYIHQDYIPAIPGKQGFKSPEDALLVGKRVIQKISRNEIPAITEEDLIELGILKK